MYFLLNKGLVLGLVPVSADAQSQGIGIRKEEKKGLMVTIGPSTQVTSDR